MPQEITRVRERGITTDTKGRIQGDEERDLKTQEQNFGPHQAMYILVIKRVYCRATSIMMDDVGQIGAAPMGQEIADRKLMSDYIRLTDVIRHQTLPVTSRL